MRLSFFYRILFLFMASLLSTSCAFARVAVTMTSPTDGATVATSPVRVTATASGTKNIQSWQVFVDGQSVFTGGAGASVTANVPVGTGKHLIEVKAYGQGNNFGSASASITVGTSSGTTPPPVTKPVVSIAPSTVSLKTGATQQFTASVTNTSNTAVTWAVNGVTGGNSTVGTISASGFYTAPATVPSGGVVTVRATSVADSTVSATATASITAATTAPVTVSLTPTAAVLQTSATQQFVASVANTSNTAVVWSVGGVQGGNSTVGTISSTGLYTAPAAVPSGGTTTVKATSVANSTASATASVSISAPPATVGVTISPTSASVASGGKQQFTATVTGTTNTSVVWLVNGVQGGNQTVGTISTTGLYTAPACAPSTGVTVTARSYYDGNASASAKVTIGTTTSPAKHYWVSNSGSNSNDGSACRPWATLQYAANNAGSGATVHVAPGTYTENGLTFSNAGTATARTRFISDQKWGAKIRTTNSYTILAIRGAYIDVLGFDAAGDSSTCLGFVSWASNTRILGNHVHNIPAALAVCGSNGGAAINNANYSATNAEISGNVVHDIGSWPTMDQRVHGIYHANSGGRISNNVAYRCAGFGIHLGHAATGVTISNNTVFNSVYGGIYIAAGDGGVLASNMVVTNNISVNNTTYGIVESIGIGTNNRYINNLVYNNKTNWALKTGSTQSGTITANPLFTNYTGGSDGTYTLQSTSPAINKGTSTGAPTIDNVGGVRPIGGAWDIGAYEYGATPAVWPWM